jgi:hypothetical protein
MRRSVDESSIDWGLGDVAVLATLRDGRGPATSGDDVQVVITATAASEQSRRATAVPMWR